MGHPVYKCFYWSGDRAELHSAESRCDPHSGLPPSSVRNWVIKPDYLCKAIFGDEHNALAWLWQQMGVVAKYAEDHFPEHVPDISRQYEAARDDLRHRDMACEWVVDLPNRRCIFVAIVAVWEEADALLAHRPREEHHEAA